MTITAAPSIDHDCRNCGSPTTGRYCSACGQRTEVEKLTLPHLLRELPHVVFHVDRGFFQTLRILFKSPGAAIIGYLDGQRIRYFNPLTLLVLLAGLSAALFTAYPFQFYSGLPRATDEEAQHFGRFVSLSFKFYSFTLLFYVPVLALITWLAFWRNRRSYGEHIVVNAFVLAGASALMILMFPVFVLADRSGHLMVMMSVSTIVSAVYLVIAWQRVYSLPGRGLSTAFRALVVFVIYTVVLGVVSQIGFRYVYLPIVA
jgi:Protein of unknown function (DUF3667)